MSIMELGALGEFVGAIGIVVTLAYLAIQIQNQNSESKVAAMHEISVGFRESITVFGDSQMAELLTRANFTDEPFSDSEMVQLIVAVQRILRVWEEAYGQHIAGRLDLQIWEAMGRQYSSVMAAPAFQIVWNLRKDYFSESFREFVDASPRTEYKIR